MKSEVNRPQFSCSIVCLLVGIHLTKQGLIG
jgi:hypothetical protein